MEQTLLSTKFNIAAACQPIILRPRLTETLAQAATHRITLVSAPAGYGKTTLVRSWLHETALPYTWLSLDEGDNDPIRFLEYFLSALHEVVPAITKDFLNLLQGSQIASFQTLMALVINEAARSGDFFMVLDDFHVLHTSSILEMLGYLFEHLPPGMHFVLLSRADPILPLSRLRAQGQLLEIRTEQLRFTTNEIARFYDEVMRLDLRISDIVAIETRTEGWIAGLQLAGLAIQNFLAATCDPGQSTKAPHSFINAFTGSHVYIMDYLTEEVLRGLPEKTRSFLLETAILDRVCGSLGEAVVGQDSKEPVYGQAMLEAIEQNHLFVIPLDNERRWFRYHYLFREVLSRRLESLFPGQIPCLHRRASEWFEKNGLIHEAVRHAILAGDSDRTTRMVEQHGCDLLMSGELVTLAGWLAAIEPYTQTRPWLAMQNAWVLSLSGQSERAELAIDAGEQLLSACELSDEVRTLRGSFAAVRAHWANTQGKTDLAKEYARQAIDLLSVSSDFSCALSSVATTLLGDASLAQGNMNEARQAYAEAVRIGQIAGNPHMKMLSSISLADVYFEQGQIRQAARLYLETLQLAKQVDGPNSSYAQGVYFGLSRVYYAWNQIEEAAVSGDDCLQLCRKWHNINLEAACLALNAQIYIARGDTENALTAVSVAEAVLQEHTLSPNWLLWVRTALARCWLQQGMIEKAFLMIHEIGVLPEAYEMETAAPAGLSLSAPIPYRLEPAYVMLARLFQAQGNSDAVLSICNCLLPEAIAGERGKTVTELLILQALAFHARKETSSAEQALRHAISIARPDQAWRIFLDEGGQMAKLLYLVKANSGQGRDLGGDFIDGLLSKICHPVEKLPSSNQSIQPLSKDPTVIIEPLSPRELEVLRAIAEGCSNQEIADRFVLSPKTVKRHISNIYGKLSAKNRTQAVSLARLLKLLN